MSTAAVLSPIAPKVRRPAPFVVGPTNENPMRPTKKIPKQLIEAARATPPVEFDAARHLCFEGPKKTYSMKEWGYEGHGISPIAASDPFPLFTNEAVQQIRREILSKPVLDNYQYESTFCSNQVRGYTQE